MRTAGSRAIRMYFGMDAMADGIPDVQVTRNGTLRIRAAGIHGPYIVMEPEYWDVLAATVQAARDIHADRGAS